MLKEKINLSYAAMLYDFEKILKRGGVDKSLTEFILSTENEYAEEIGNILKYSDKDALLNSNLPYDSLEYILYFAKSIATLSEGSEKDNEVSLEPLHSIFNKLNGNDKRGVYEENSIYPAQEEVKLSRSYYEDIVKNIEAEIRNFTGTGEDIQSLLTAMEKYTSGVPAGTDEKNRDISVFEHSKLIAAFANAIYDYLEQNNISDFKSLLTDEEYFTRKIFYLYSFDFSGIQNFIYTIVSNKALKTLRTRSFYLEIFMEDVIDTLLEELNLTRINLLYAGGGHCYLLFPNTEKTLECIEAHKNNVNKYLIDEYGIELYIAGGGSSCAPETFKEGGGEKYGDLFRNVSKALSDNKLNRYSAEDLINLNFKEAKNNERECNICHRTDRIHESEDGLICENCLDIQRFSREIIKAKCYVIEKAGANKPFASLPLPYGKRIVATSKEDLPEKMKEENFIRAYSKNDNEIASTIKLWVGDYAYDDKLEIFTEDSEGVNRLAVIRGDIDNLGQAFVKGFSKEYTSLTRNAVFSHSLSKFFKYEINNILEEGTFFLTDRDERARKALIVYSGGDDVFVLGAWNDILEFAVDLHNRFKAFSMGALTLSAGIGIYPERFSIKLMSEATGKLEDAAKSNKYMKDNVEMSKNSVCIFNEDLAFSWEDFIKNVLGEKFSVIKKRVTNLDDKGKVFLYRVLELFTKMDDKLNLARLAYTLARAEPKEEELRKIHQEFSKAVYKFAKSAKDRKEFIAAMHIFLYLERR